MDRSYLLRSTTRARAVGAVVLLGVLVALQALAPAAFVPLVTLALVLAPTVNWHAWWRLRGKLVLVDGDGKGEDIASLRTATNAALLLAWASTVTAALGVFVAARAVGLVSAVAPDVFLILLSYPPLLMTGPAFDWLVTVGRIERGEE